jgi:hypothetical protein
MDRREIFNILFKGRPVYEPIVFEPDPVLETPAHLKTDQAVRVFKEWRYLPADGNFNFDLSAEYPFTITLDLNYPAESADDQNDVSRVHLLLGVKNEHQTLIKTGFNEQGYLFIDKVIDLRPISRDKLLAGVQLVLTVNPLPMGMSFAKLKIMDRAGLTLSTLKSRQYTMADWAGKMSLTCPDFNFLQVDSLRTVLKSIDTEHNTQLK